MKIFTTKCKFLFTLLALGFFGSSLSAQTIYVKGDVTGGDGSSWAMAYQYLDDAIAAADSGAQIWVAAGTYYPGAANPTRDTFYNMKNGVDLYGGFAGTETMVSQRNIELNPTVLSGDFDQNDTDGEFITAERLTNTRNVFIVDTLVQDAILDGFTISHGNADTTTANQMHRGGGMLIFGAPTIRNCTFEQNYALLGAAAYPRFINASGTIFDNCLFQDNAGDVGGAMYIFSNVGVVLNDCTFQRNSGNFGGAVYVAGADQVGILTCAFDNNTAGTSAAAVYADNSTILFENLSVTNNTARFGGFGRLSAGTYGFEDCLFEDNNVTDLGGSLLMVDATFSMEDCIVRGNNCSGGSGGGVYTTRSLFTMENITIDSNSCTGFGGGLYTIASSYAMDDCLISANNAGTGAGEGGGGIYTGAFDADTSRFVISNTTFSFNDSPFSCGIASYGNGTAGIIEDCTFASNTSNFGGAGIGCSFQSTTSVENCLFTNNTAGYGGGLFVGGNLDSNTVFVSNCEFDNNTATTIGGGAVYIAEDGIFLFDSCQFSNNIATAGFGGAINYSPDSFALNQAVFRKSEFLNNNGFDQGGAVNINDGDVTFINCLLNFNKVTSDPMSDPIQGRGGAFANNASASDTSILTLVHCTVVNSDGDFAGGISQWEADATAHAVLALQNNIIASFGTNYAIEDGTPEVESFGGNLSNDATFDTYFTGTNDAGSITDFAFIDEYAETDFELLENSPAVDIGVTSPFVVEDDVRGELRDGSPDAGAYEYIINVSTRPEIGDESALSLSPNPATIFTQMTLNHEYTGEYQIKINNTLGQLMYSFKGTKSSTELRQTIPLGKWAPGLYEFSIELGDEQVTQKLMVK